jgi:hypothetical protein
MPPKNGEEEKTDSRQTDLRRRKIRVHIGLGQGHELQERGGGHSRKYLGR